MIQYIHTSFKTFLPVYLFLSSFLSRYLSNYYYFASDGICCWYKISNVSAWVWNVSISWCTTSISISDFDSSEEDDDDDDDDGAVVVEHDVDDDDCVCHTRGCPGWGILQLLADVDDTLFSTRSSSVFAIESIRSWSILCEVSFENVLLLDNEFEYSPIKSSSCLKCIFNII